MIYLRNISDAQVIFVPKSGQTKGTDLSLRLYNTIDHDILVDQVVDLGTSQLYYNLSVALPADLADGEYHYDLLSEGSILSSGLLIIGGAEKPNEYKKDITYEQYNG